MQIPKLIKYIAATIGTVILGAIGSGVWEVFLSPILKLTSTYITKTLSSISIKYSDAFYLSAASTFNNSHYDDLLKFTLFLLATYTLAIFLIKKLNPNIDVKRFFISWRGIISFCGFLMFVVILLSRTSSVNQLNRYTNRNLEILRPYIGEQKYLELRSDYFSMENTKDYENFQTKMKKFAAENEFRLKK